MTSTARRILPARDGADLELREGETASYVVSNNNRWSRTTFRFEGLEAGTWCELVFQIEWDPQEQNRSAHDFAVVGFDFLTEDGSSIDFAHVPGLTRTQLDPHSWYVAGPDYVGQGGRSSRIACGFFVPSPARTLSVGIRSWRNSHPFVVREPRLLNGPPTAASETVLEAADQADGQSASHGRGPRRTWREIGAEPVWYSFGVLPGRRLLIRGQIINEALGPDGALARIVYRDAQGKELPPPYPELAAAPAIGAFIDIPVHRQARRFTLDLASPLEAASVEVGFQTWNGETRMELVTPLEVSLEDELLLETISGDELPDSPTFLKQLMHHLGLIESPSEPVPVSFMLQQWADPRALSAPLTFLDKLRTMQSGDKAKVSGDALSLGDFAPWPLPKSVEWTEDPFQSSAWRLEFQSLSWICDLAADGKPESLAKAVDLAVSWSRANSWGQPRDPISAHPRALSARAEAFVTLLSLSVRSAQALASRNILVLMAESVRHGCALAQILGQTIFSHSIAQIHAACALLALARALPRVPLAPFWTSIALTQLRDGFDRLVDGSGSFLEQSLHARLELVSLGLIVIRQLQDLPETQEFRDDLNERLRIGLRAIVAATDPSGSLPPFGDAPYGSHHASWLRRLLSNYGTHLLSDHELAAELSYPTGRKVFTSATAGLITARTYEQNANWSYLCVSLDGRRHEQGHFDATSFVYSTGGLPWIVDPRGSSLHEAGAARQYLVSSRAHNVALPDGREQMSGAAWLEHHEAMEGAQLFQIGTNVHGPDYRHHRIVLSLDDLQAVAILDHFTVQSRPVCFQGHLHVGPGIIVAIANTQLAVAYRRHDKLRFVPRTILGQFNGLSIENGRNDRPGSVQGFAATSSGRMQPASVLQYRFSGHGSVCGGALLAANDRAARTLSNLLETEAVKALLARLSAAGSET